MDIRRYLREHPLLEEVAEETVGALAEAAREVHFAPGELLVREGDPEVVFGILRRGRAEAVQQFASAAPRRLVDVEEGQCFGEMALLTGEAARASVVATTGVDAVLLPEDALASTIATNPASVRYLSRLIARRLEASRDPASPLPAGRSPAYALGASRPMRILVVNCGSSSLKYSYFDTSSPRPLARGLVERVDSPEPLHRYRGPEGTREEAVPGPGHARAFEAARAALTAPSGGVLARIEDLDVIGHRVVHGGEELDVPTLVTAEVKETIRRLASLAPLHNPVNLLGVEECERLAPGVPQVAVFDTAFHQKMPKAAYTYAIPRELAAREGLRRYGFHGTSHEFVARTAAAHLRRRFGELKIITCHLGSGASVAAIEHGRSVDTSMGLTPLEGLVMGTRSGDIDPGLLIWILREGKCSLDELDRMLQRDSGLKGLSGTSGDMREIEAAAEAGDPAALTAIRCFCYRTKKYVGSYLAALGGADVLVFTGGIGEGSAGTRARVCQGLGSLGVLVDEERNRTADVAPGECVDVSDRESRVRVLVVGTDEERMIAHEAVRAVRDLPVTEVLQRKGDRTIPVATSAHHVHLTREHFETLFGRGKELTWHADLSQPGQFAAKERVDLVGPKARIDRVRILGPFRPRSQVEISRTEEYRLGIDAPIRASGDLDGTPGLRLEGPEGHVDLESGVINAWRHIHMSPEDALEFALRDRDIVRVQVEGPRSLTFGDVLVRVHPQYRLEMHIDTDEANAAEIRPGAACHLEAIQERPRADI